MKNVMGNGEFKQKLVAVYGAAKITGPMLQELIEDGLRQAMHPSIGGHGSLNRLTLVLKACQTVKTLPTRTIQRYIQQHVDAKWCKLKDGENGFKYNGAPDASLPEVSWYDWSGNTQKNAKVDKDILDMLKNVKRQAALAKKKGGVVKHEGLLSEIDSILRKAELETA